MSWNWPQYAVLTGTAISLLLAAHFHGKTRIGKWEFWPTLTAKIMLIIVLYYGGFWK